MIRNIYILLVLQTFLFSADYYADTTGTDNSFCSQSDPCEHIQTAINLTSNGDVVIVSGGTYLENLLIETGITLKSLDAADPAIIDGSSPETDPALWNGGSCIVIRTPSGASSRVTATVEDVHLTGGKGTTIIEDSNKDGDFDDVNNPNDPDIEKKVGGGMIVHKAGLTSRRNKIMNNGDSSTKEGGAVYAAGTGADIPDDQPADPPEDHFPNERLLIEFEETIFSDNNAQIGHTIMVNGWDPENQFIDIDFGNSQFDVAFDSEDDDLDGVSEYWIKGKDNSTFDFTGGITGENDAIITDVWVDPNNGIDEGNISGDQNNPFLTINYAMGMIYPTEDNPITIYLTEGEFSPSINSESYPIIMSSNVNIIGQGEDVTIIDAEAVHGVISSEMYAVIEMQYCENNILSDFTIIGGYNIGSIYQGCAAINIFSSNPNINQITVRDNYGPVICVCGNYNEQITHTWGGDQGEIGGSHSDIQELHIDNITVTENKKLMDYVHVYYKNAIGIDISYAGRMKLTNSIITNNEGPGIEMGVSNAILSNLIISGNGFNSYGSANSYGGGISIGTIPEITSVPILTNIVIENNQAPFGGGLSVGGPAILNNLTIVNNISYYSAGPAIHGASYEQIYKNVTIYGNFSELTGSNPHQVLAYCEEGYGSPTFINSIIWDDTIAPFSIYSPDDATVVASYCDINGDWEGEGNIDQDPLFTDPSYGDYTLGNESPCIDTGDSSLWYLDLDGSRGDMGATGGLSVNPNFTEFNFGLSGPVTSTKYFELFNYRQDPIVIEDVEFSTTSFNSSTSFPIIIDPFETGTIEIHCLPQQIGQINDEMTLISDDLPEGISVVLTVESVEDNIMPEGNIWGTLPSGSYQIIGDINVLSGDILTLEAGTEFLFDGEYSLTVEGVLKAEGTELDSIVFDNYGINIQYANEKWRGLVLENVTEETILKYVRISGAYGNGVKLLNGNPIFENVTISGNQSGNGGGMYLFNSNPILENVKIIHNNGGGMYLKYSSPVLNNVEIIENTAIAGAGIHFASNYLIEQYTNFVASHPIMNNVTIANNTAENYDYYGEPIYHLGGGLHGYVRATITNSIIWGNIPESICIMSEAVEDYLPIINYSNIQQELLEEPSYYSCMPANSEDPGWGAVANTWEGENNLSIDPQFIEPESSDFSLQEGSPCIDAGTADLDGDGYEDMEYCGDAPDMGAFEFITEDCEESTLSGDLNSDGLINVLDVVVLVNIVLGYGEPVDAGDMNGDGILNVLDVVMLVDIILNP